MKKFFIENSEYSMLRLLSFLSVVSGLIIVGFIISLVFMKSNLEYIRELIYLSATLLAFGFGGKVFQKFGEKNP